jgi:hypothetical protein
MIDGRTAPELASKGPAALEVAGLWGDIKSAFQQTSKTSKRV